MIDSRPAPDPDPATPGPAATGVRLLVWPAPGDKLAIMLDLVGNEHPAAPEASIVLGFLTAAHLGLAMMKIGETKFSPPDDFPIDAIAAAIDVTWHKACDLLKAAEEEVAP